MDIDAIIIYLESHPLAAVGLVVLAVMVLGSIIKKLVKAAVILILIFLAGLYWTNHEASSADWRTQFEKLKKKATEFGEEALEKGEEALEKAKEKGEEALEKAKETAKENGEKTLEKAKKEVKKKMKENE